MSDLRKAAKDLLRMAISATNTTFMNPQYHGQKPRHRSTEGWFIPSLGMEALRDALRAALARPEPVAWRYLEDPWGANEYLITDDPNTAKGPGWTPLYTHPPQRKPLTDDRINEIAEDSLNGTRAIEKAHGIGGEHD